MTNNTLPILGIDLDNIISDTDKLVRLIIYELHEIKLEREDIIFFEYSKCGITKEQESEVFHVFHERRCSEVIPKPGAVEKIKKLNEKFQVHIVTSRPLSVKNKTIKWLCDYNINYDDIDFRTDKHTSEISFDYFIEDKKDTAYKLAYKGINTIIMDKPWNQPNPKDIDNITRVYSWEEIFEYLSK